MPLNSVEYDNHESVNVVRDVARGLTAVIAIHDTTLGPAHGGTRFWHYPNPAAAVDDALRLSRGMTYKNALAGLPFGGGKSVILADARHSKPVRMLEAFADAVESLGGRYICAEDVGIAPADMSVIASRTRHACGVPVDGDEAAANPAPFTARGVFLAMGAGMAHVRAASGQHGSESLDGVRVAVQGAGGVGSVLCALLAGAGASVVLCDANAQRAEQVAERLGARVVAVDGIHDADVDVFAPCALGGSLSLATAARLRAKLVCGAANNQLAEPAVDAALAARGIAYLPDFVVNAGGVMHTTSQLTDSTLAQVHARVERIPGRVREVLALAARTGMHAQAAAEQLAREVLASAAAQRDAPAQAHAA